MVSTLQELGGYLPQGRLLFWLGRVAGQGKVSPALLLLRPLIQNNPYAIVADLGGAFPGLLHNIWTSQVEWLMLKIEKNHINAYQKKKISF